ncbi:Inositolphosphorylceramide synthase subunit Kei1-domain-containing protein [Irpex rosettiformis]|uniref:Inositolphosphorylceramide synthase subunit Kei1-domain-containing protein n=1 Tax=Irpex rosettiformis TaxID=378272 RepID=A0ACB8TPN0_9APHY|nr:Inositolphosphorylceramide synthase subunit Kei1-domain-containing protein [Irpex rosettiformis]
MKLTLRPEWRLRPLSSFLGLADLKAGVTIAILFAGLNKVAGVYGLLAVLTGAGGSLAQISMYMYSALALVALIWGLKSVSKEDAKHTLYFAHAFFADHVFSTAWTIYFAVLWWIYTPHDGRQEITSPAQREIMEAGGGGNSSMTPIERIAAATTIWNEEKGTSMTVIVVGWFIKIYFALLLYSYAIHLRKGSYRNLPMSRAQASATYAAVNTIPDDDDDPEDFHLPIHAPPPPPPGHGHTPSGSSISSFADFVSAPGRARRQKAALKSSKLNPANGKIVVADGADDMDEVLFDEHETANGGFDSASASGSGGKDSADEESNATSSNDDRRSKGPRRTSKARAS